VNCRFCAAPLEKTFVDLGMQPLSNAFVDAAAVDGPETFFPLHARVCSECLLVQLPELQSPEQIFQDYHYLSSVSDSWLAHCSRFAAQAIERFGLATSSLVVEVASNDGGLLRYFKDNRIPVLGIEPAANVAAIANDAGIPSLPRFFGSALAKELVASGKRADLLVGNNVLAHVPDLNDFVGGLAALLAPDGVLSLEFPHLARLVEEGQFDTIYHEHFSYFSFGTAERVLRAHGLVTFDVEELPTHGGSLRVLARHEGSKAWPTTARVAALHRSEEERGLHRMETYAAFEARVREIKNSLLEFFIGRRRAGKHVVAYGAPAKGNTLLNYCGIRTDFIDYAVDKNPLKQNKFLPGTHIPIRAPDRIRETRPDYVLILPWNIKDEIIGQLAPIREWGGQFVLPIPQVKVIP
jgi:SAM-dependent methyltransferase